VVAAAGLGGALGADGLPTLTLEEARRLYRERRFAAGVVAWTACAPPSGPLGSFQRAGGGGYWVVGDLERYRDDRRPSGELVPPAWSGDRRCRDGDLDAGAGLGWTLFEGSRPVLRARDLEGGPADCAPLRLRVATPPHTDASGNLRGGRELVDVEMPPRVQDCGTRTRWEEFAGLSNARIVSDLRISGADVADLGASPSTLDGFVGCAWKRPTDAMTELCAIE
jgi:hypothetical protein